MVCSLLAGHRGDTTCGGAPRTEQRTVARGSARLILPQPLQGQSPVLIHEAPPGVRHRGQGGAIRRNGNQEKWLLNYTGWGGGLLRQKINPHF